MTVPVNPIFGLRRLAAGRFVRHVAVLAGGSAGAQVILIAFAPWLARLYGPEAFGVLGTFSAVVAMGAPVVALAYPIAIMLPREDAEAAAVAWLSVLATTIATLVLLILFLGWGDGILRLLQIGVLRPYALLIPVVIFFSGIRQVIQQWLIRMQRFRWIARVSLAQAVLLSLAKLAFGWHHPVATTLIALTVAGSVLHAGMLGAGAAGRRPATRGAERSRPTRMPIAGLAGRYADFPLFRAPQIAINAFSQALPVIMLTAFFGPVPAGLYTLCMRVLAGVPQLISVAVGDVFYPRFTQALHRGENLLALLLKSTAGLASIGVLPFALVVGFGPMLFGWVFGEAWVGAGVYARWLAIWLFFQFINRPCVMAVPALGIQKGFMVYEIMVTLAKVAALAIGFAGYRLDHVAVALFSMVGAAAYLVLLAWVMLAARTHDRDRRRDSATAPSRETSP